MADFNEGVHVPIEVDPGGSEAAVSSIDSRMSALEQTIIKLIATSDSGTAATEKHGASHEKAAEGVKKHGDAQDILGAKIGKAEYATNAAARAASALGLSTAAATERIMALTEALDAIKETAGPLIAVGAALLAVGEALHFVHESIDVASEMEDAMVRLETAVDNTGTKFDEAREKIELFLQVQSEATGYTKGELIRSLDDLATAGVSVGDSMKIVRISEDVARASGKSLEDVTNSLKMAETGRPFALERIDMKLKPLIERHAHLSEIMRQLQHDMEDGAARASETLSGKWRALHVAVDELQEMIGNFFLPTLKDMVDRFMGAGVAIEAFADGAKLGFSAVGDMIKDLGNSLFHLAKAMGEFGAWDFKSAQADFKEAMTSNTATSDKFFESLKRMNSAATWDWGKLGRSLQSAHGAWKKVVDSHDESGWDNDPNMGHLGKGHKPKVDHSAERLAAQEQAMAIRERIQQLEQLVKTHQITAAQAVEAEMTIRDQYKLTLAEVKEVYDSEHRIGLMWIADQKARAKYIAEYFKKDWEEHLKAAREKAAALDKELKDFIAAQDRMVKYHHETLEQMLANLDDFVAKHAALTDVERRDVVDKEAQIANSAAEASFRIIEERIKQKNETIAAALAELEAELAKYKAMGDAGVEAADKIIAEIQKVRDMQTAADQKAADEYKKQLEKNQSELDAWSGKVYDFFEKTNQKSKGLFQEIGDGFKTMLADMERAFIKSTISSLLSHALGLPVPAGGGFSLGGALGLPGSSAKDQNAVDLVKHTKDTADNTAAIADALGNGPDAAPPGTLGAILQGPGSSLLGGAGGGVAAVAGALLGGGGGAGIADMANGSFGGWADQLGGGGGGGAGGFGGLGNLANLFGKANAGRFTGALAGFGVGTFVNQLLGGNSTWGGVGSALGSGVGAIFGGPLGSLIGGGLGGALGGLFGPHWGPPSNYPDRSDTQNYGQIIADLVGHAGANGQNFTESSNISSLTGGQTEAGFIQNLLANGKPSWMSQAQYQQALGFFGTNSSAQLQHGTHIGELWYGSGQHMQYTDVANLASQILQGYQTSGGAANNPIPFYSVSRSMPNYNIGNLVAGGMYNPLTGQVTGASLSAVAGAVSTIVGHPSAHLPDPLHPIVINIGSVDSNARVTQISRALSDVYNRNLGGGSAAGRFYA